MGEYILILLVGLPQSGKSTWARKQGLPIVNPDSIRMALHGRPFIREAEPMVWAIAKFMVRALFLAGHPTVIVDATNTTKKRRDEWLSENWRCVFKVVGGPEDKDVCIERAKRTCSNAEHLEGLCAAIVRMTENYEPVAETEGELLVEEGGD